jgi:trehalose synthase
MSLIDSYLPIVGKSNINAIRQLGENLDGKKVVHVNSTKQGGGVAEILSWLVPLMKELGIETSWEVIEGDAPFFEVTKTFHNTLQGYRIDVSPAQLRKYEEINRVNSLRLRPALEEADFVFIHDPQPAYLLKLCNKRKGKWFWRCHIDASNPYRPVWKYLRDIVSGYDASIFSTPQFAQPLDHPQFLIAPSIDPLSEKNVELEAAEVTAVLENFNIDPSRPVLTQISRYDRFKDPIGVIKAYKLVKKNHPVQLVLAGGSADDDPEGAAVLAEVREAAEGDPNIHILELPPDAHRTINALQRGSAVIIQKSLREGFGLTVTEGLWKGKPVIGGDVGGIRLQVINFHTGFLVNTPEGVAHWTDYLLQNHDKKERMGRKGKEFVRENYLLTRQLREYLTLMVGIKDEMEKLMVA